MKLIENTAGVHLMTWTTNPRLRNTNNVITFIAKNELEFEEGDYILGTADMTVKRMENTQRALAC